MEEERTARDRRRAGGARPLRRPADPRGRRRPAPGRAPPQGRAGACGHRVPPERRALQAGRESVPGRGRQCECAHLGARRPAGRRPDGSRIAGLSDPDRRRAARARRVPARRDKGPRGLAERPGRRGAAPAGGARRPLCEAPRRDLPAGADQPTRDAPLVPHADRIRQPRAADDLREPPGPAARERDPEPSCGHRGEARGRRGQTEGDPRSARSDRDPT